MAYVSPFDRLEAAARNEYTTFNYLDALHGYGEGSIAKYLSELKAALHAAPNTKILATLAFHPAKIIAAILDYKIQKPWWTNKIPLLIGAVELGFAVYRGAANDSDLDKFEFDAMNLVPDLIEFNVYWPHDGTTWRASSPRRSKDAAEKLSEKMQGRSILFIPLANGGIAAGMDVFLRYYDVHPNQNSAFYPVRYSRHKHSDRAPRAAPSEINYLKGACKKRGLVIFDEDSWSGGTLRGAQRFFGRELNKKPIGLVNADADV